MKIQKALKYKKRLGADIAKVQALIQRKNSTTTESVNKYDVQALVQEYEETLDKLLRLKDAINRANLPIQKSIYTLAELKGKMGFLDNINTREGTVSSYGDKFTVYTAVYDELAVSVMLKETQDKIDTLQEEIDTFNYTTEVDFSE